MTAVLEHDLGAPTLLVGTVSPIQGLADARAVIEHAITHHPRSLQKSIGPSEIGTPCDHCLAAKLAGWEQTDDGIPWLPTIGTAVHAWIEEQFCRHQVDQLGHLANPDRRWFTEARVMVGHIGGREVWGSTDLLDLAATMTVDWKVVGPTTLRTVKVSGPSPVYRVQADLYAKGWNDAGYRVDHVAIAYLPRNAVSLDQAIWWTAPHDRGRAEQALVRANRVAANLAALSALGDAAVAAWISSQPRDPGCHDCHRYPDGLQLTPPGHKSTNPSPLTDLIG